MLNEYSGKEILITGGHGFLGEHLVAKLREYGASVTSPTREEYDLRQQTDVDELFRSLGPFDYVFNLAANTTSYRVNVPYSIYYDNIMIGTNVLDYAVRYRVGKFVQIGTIASYPAGIQAPFQSNDLWKGSSDKANSGYGLTMRLISEQLISAYKQYQFPGIYLILPYLYGEGDHYEEDRLHTAALFIQRIVDAHKKEEPIIQLWGGVSSHREFFYVQDAVQAITYMGVNYANPCPVNLGSGTTLSLKEFADLIVDIVGYQGRIAWVYDPPDPQPFRSLNSESFQELVKLKTTPIKEGLQRTIQWYMEHSCK